ncbi:hypothetical protein [Cupriavidus sp. SK-4]|uniref:hypothetical protein n=1 Tax=Cupriavidus sp. SK-4 TaxID=574750 RepID=UPI00190F1667|nr:hypothetical protein [Cupriavidus sp. SK-4]
MPKFNLYTSELLPEGFRYAPELSEMAATGDYYPVGQWWFIDASSKAGRLAYSVRNHDGRNLIPFAKVDDGRGDVACFDGNDHSGDPVVLMLILDHSKAKLLISQLPRLADGGIPIAVIWLPI